MKVVALLGSPKKNGNTARILAFLDALVSNHSQIELISIASYEINGCLGCKACFKIEDKPGCVQDDDAVSIFERMMKADLVIYASPLYFWGFPAQFKALIDRHFCLIKGYGKTRDIKSLLEGKPVALIVTCDGPVDNNAEFIQGTFDRIAYYYKCKVVGKYILPFCMAADTIDKKGMDLARKMAADIAGLDH